MRGGAIRNYGWNRGAVYKLHPVAYGMEFFIFDFLNQEVKYMINVTLKGGVIKEYENGITAMEIAKDLGMGLYKAACVAKINGEVKDLRTPLNEDCELQILTFDDDDGKSTYRHTASHVLAQAVKRLYPDAKLAIGPSIENGFYYDFDVESPFTPEDLEKIEAEMKKIIKEDLPLEHFEMTPEEAIAYYKNLGEIYKVELVEEHAGKGETGRVHRTVRRPSCCINRQNQGVQAHILHRRLLARQ